MEPVTPGCAGTGRPDMSENLDVSENSDIWGRMTPDVFDALANPIRRELLGLLRAGPKPVNELAGHFHRGRPAISEHLAVLRGAGLVREEPRGRQRFYHLDPAPLREVADWLAAYEVFWAGKLDDLKTLLDREHP